MLAQFPNYCAPVEGYNPYDYTFNAHIIPQQEYKILYVLSKADLKKGLIPIPQGTPCPPCPITPSASVFFYRPSISNRGVCLLHEQREPWAKIADRVHALPNPELPRRLQVPPNPRVSWALEGHLWRRFLQPAAAPSEWRYRSGISVSAIIFGIFPRGDLCDVPWEREDNRTQCQCPRSGVMQPRNPVSRSTRSMRTLQREARRTSMKGVRLGPQSTKKFAHTSRKCVPAPTASFIGFFPRFRTPAITDTTATKCTLIQLCGSGWLKCRGQSRQCAFDQKACFYIFICFTFLGKSWSSRTPNDSIRGGEEGIGHSQWKIHYNWPN